MRPRLRLEWLFTLLIIAAAPAFTAPYLTPGNPMASSACSGAAIERVVAKVNDGDTRRQHLLDVRGNGTITQAAQLQPVRASRIRKDMDIASNARFPKTVPIGAGCELHVERQRGYPRVRSRQHG